MMCADFLAGPTWTMEIRRCCSCRYELSNRIFSINRYHGFDLKYGLSHTKPSFIGHPSSVRSQMA